MRVLFCGLGSIGQRHLRNLRAVLGDRLEVHAYRVRRLRHKFSETLAIEPDADVEKDYRIVVHSNLDQALSARPDAVFVCNPSSLHVPIALAAARCGSHLFIEKPLSDSITGTDELSEVVKANGLICYVGYNFRFHPGLIRMKELIDHGFFGNIVSARAEIGEYMPDWHTYEDYRGTYPARKELGGGAILTQIHEIDLIYWFFGLPRSICCHGGKLSDLEIDVEDSATSLMRYEGPHGRFPIALHQDFLQRTPVRTFKIVGDAGSAEIDLIRNVLRSHSGRDINPVEIQYSEFKRNDMFLDQARHVIACLVSEATPKVDLHAGIQSLRLALAAKEALASGREVDLKPGTS
jgi:predicted dehydrogenase